MLAGDSSGQTWTPGGGGSASSAKLCTGNEYLTGQVITLDGG